MIYHLVTPQITFDADEISPSADTAQDFSNLDSPVKYTLSSAADEDVTYTVHIERVGDDPYLESLTVDGQYGETEYEDDNVKLVLKSSAKLNSVEPVFGKYTVTIIRQKVRRTLQIQKKILLSTQ